MTTGELIHLRLKNQQLLSSEYKSAGEIVSYMGIMQSQDLMMSLWGAGIRSPRSQRLNEQEVIEAVNSGAVIRTHVIRPTWHFVSPEDIGWMIDLSAPRILSASNRRFKELGLTAPVINKCLKIIETSLAENEFCSRDELINSLAKSNIKNDDNRASHILMIAELEKLICSGILKNNKQTYALYSRRIKRSKKLSRDKALTLLSGKYFTSRSPASLEDFVNWSYLSTGEARCAAGMLDKKFSTEIIEGNEYLTRNSRTSSAEDSVLLLPAFDEYIIGYRNRSAVIHSDHIKRTVLRNGLFSPVVLINGVVKGLWKRTIKKETVIIEATMFGKYSKKLKSSIEEAASEFAAFLGRQMSFIISEV